MLDGSASPMARPASFPGTEENCSGFLLQCSLFFLDAVTAFSNRAVQNLIQYIISLLSAKALQGARTLWESDAPVRQSLGSFTTRIKAVFVQAANAVCALSTLQPPSRTLHYC